MNWIKKIIRPLLLFGLPLVVIACTVSYKFNGSSINYDKVKTISMADPSATAQAESECGLAD